MRAILAGTRGLAGVALVFVIAWALTAVVLLTGTLVSAQQIDRDVRVINPRLSSIQENTANIALARETKRLTAEIRAAAEPLTGEVAGTLKAAEAIEVTATSILGKAQSINRKVVLIHDNVLAIGSTVNAIDANVQSIRSSVVGIHASVTSVGFSVQSILSSALTIGASVDSIRARARGILAEGRSIVPAVNGINRRAVTVGGAAEGIRADLAAVLAAVGSDNRARTIDGHANAIDCSALLNTPLFGGPTTGCGK